MSDPRPRVNSAPYELRETLRFIEMHQYRKAGGGLVCCYCNGWHDDHTPLCKAEERKRRIRECLAHYPEAAITTSGRALVPSATRAG